MPPNPWLSKHTAPNIHHCATVEEAAAVVVQQERYISSVKAPPSLVLQGRLTQLVEEDDSIVIGIA